MIEKYTKKNGTTAYKFVAYLGVDPLTGKQVRTTRMGFKTKREAERVEFKLKEDFERSGSWKKVEATTFDDVAQLWFEHYEKTVRPSTFCTTQYHYSSQIKKFFGQIRINKVTVVICQKFAANVSSFGTYSLYLSIVNRILKFSISMGLIDSNPMDKIIRPKSTHVPKSEYVENYYSKSELEQFLKLVEEQRPLEDLVIYRILAYGGLRIGELTALDESDVDFKNGTVNINKTHAKIKGVYVIQEPKTKKSKRIIPLDSLTMKLIKQHLDTMPIQLYGSRRICQVFPKAVACRLDKIIRKNNLKRITPHGFRHTHASLLYEAGVPVKVAQERLGHAKISITMDIYTHLSKNQKNDAVEKLFDYIAM
ncbi:Site-specific recombinase XerD [Streptococcus henryi]|uniref:Site-specific recombinase XerD n=1 Tax=Streptococcus henryi TaxID=439219 RepID=A0A1G6AL53_9STRE|nr:site-specific integrase [Streptococcus henryi]SDB09135.1 Site-specific recombinase XerD [Streptococcus henryi]